MRRLVAAVIFVLCLNCSAGHAANRTWLNLGTDFNTGTNWTGLPGTGDVGVFNVVKVVNPNLSSSLTIQQVEFSTTATSGYDLMSSNSSIKLTLTNTVTGAGAAIRSANNSGTNTVSAPIILGAASGTQTIRQENGGTLIVNGVVSSTNTIGLGLRSTGGGTIELNGANTYSGGTSINSNNIILILGNNSALGSGSFVINGTSTLQAGGGARVISNATSLDAVTTISGTNNLTLSGVVSGNFALTKSGACNLTLSGANTYTDVTTVSAGVINIQHATALGTTAGGTSVTSGAALQLQGSIAVGAEALTLNGGGISSDGALRNISGSNSWSGNLTLGSASTIASDAGTLTLSGTLTNAGFGLTVSGSGNIVENGVVSGTGGLTKSGGGTLTLAATNTYTGATVINGSTVNVNSASSLGNTSAGLTINAGTLEVSTGFSTSRAITLSNAASTFQVDPSQTYTTTAAIGGTGALNKTGTGTMVVSGANTYSGGTVVAAGTLRISASERLADAGALTVSGGTFDVQTFSETVGTVSLTSGTITGNGAGRLTGSSYAVQSGTVSAILAGSGTLTKTTSGNVTLTGTNTLTGGAVTVSGGNLIAAGASGSALGSVSSITLNSGGTLRLGANDQINNAATVTMAGGTIEKGNFSEGSTTLEGMGALTLTAAGSHLDFGTGTVGILSIASLNVSTFTLTIDNWTGHYATVGSGSTDRLIFDADQSGNLSSFYFTGYGAGGLQFNLGGGYWEVVAAIPETSTWISGLLAGGPVFALHMRRRRARGRHANLA